MHFQTSVASDAASFLSLYSGRQEGFVQPILTNLRAVNDALIPYKNLCLPIAMVMLGIYLIFLFGAITAEAIRRIPEWRQRFGPTWYISTWQQDGNGNWLHQPILSVDGAKYVFDTPQEYIAVFQEIGRRCGDRYGYVKRIIEELHRAARFRASIRTTKGLPSDIRIPAKPPAPQEPSPIPPIEEVLEAARYETGYAASIAPRTQPAPTALPQPAAPAAPRFTTLPPQDGIVLILKRSQRQGALGGIIYMLDARIDAPAEVRAIILKHSLGSRVVYESSSRQKRNEAIRDDLERTHNDTSLLDPASVQLKGAGNALWHLGRAAVSAAIATLSLRVTVDSLFSGVHVECKSMEELLEAEQAIKQAKATLEGYIDVLTTFDGRQQVV